MSRGGGPGRARETRQTVRGREDVGPSDLKFTLDVPRPSDRSSELIEVLNFDLLSLY